MKNAALALTALAACLLASAPARAADFDGSDIGHGGVVSNWPGCGVVSGGATAGSIWLGHFTGGNVGPNGPVPGGVDWRDVYACFPSPMSCNAWQRDMRRQFHGLQGYRTCLVIR